MRSLDHHRHSPLWFPFRIATCLILSRCRVLTLAVWTARTRLSTASAGNPTSTASWCELRHIPGLHESLWYSQPIQWCHWINPSFLPTPLPPDTVAVITVMNGFMAIASTSQRRRQIQFANGTAWDAEVMSMELLLFLFSRGFFCSVGLCCIMFYMSLIIKIICFRWSSSPDEDPSLEIRYRSKKNREKEPDSDRTERQYSTPSTPDYRSERRRGSKVCCI